MGTIGTYMGKSLETFERLTNGMKSWTPNQFYVNEQYGQIFYISSQGYLHVLQKEGDCVEDYMLTKDDELKWVSTYCRPKYDKEDWEQFKEMIKEAERV
jgi:hypothetical protein